LKCNFALNEALALQVRTAWRCHFTFAQSLRRSLGDVGIRFDTNFLLVACLCCTWDFGDLGCSFMVASCSNETYTRTPYWCGWPHSKGYSSQDTQTVFIRGKIRIVLAGLRGEDTIAELCRQEGIAQSQYYSWSKEFLEAGKKRLAGDTAREANAGDVQTLLREVRDLKEVGETILLEGERVKHNTFKQRRLQYRNKAA